MFVCKSKICKQYEQRTFPIDSRCRERCYCCCKYFHRSISIIRKTWIIETDSGTYSYTMHGMNHTSPPSSSSSSVTFVRNYSRVRRISFGCVSIIDFYFFLIFYGRILFETLLVPIHANTFTVTRIVLCGLKTVIRPITLFDSYLVKTKRAIFFGFFFLWTIFDSFQKTLVQTYVLHVVELVFSCSRISCELTPWKIELSLYRIRRVMDK